MEYRFVALLECQNSGCGELVAVSGTQTADVFQVGPSDYDEVKHFSPSHMTPAPNVFPIPAACPAPVADELKLAFAQVWSDTGAAANHLRAAVEALLTERGVARTTLSSTNKRVQKKLHARIEQFRQRSPEAAEYLMAIKWIGNTGSHAGADVDSPSLLEGFELFEHALDLIYVRTAAKLKRVAKRVTARKGKPVVRRSAR